MIGQFLQQFTDTLRKDELLFIHNNLILLTKFHVNCVHVIRAELSQKDTELFFANENLNLICCIKFQEFARERRRRLTREVVRKLYNPPFSKIDSLGFPDEHQICVESIKCITWLSRLGGVAEL